MIVLVRHSVCIGMLIVCLAGCDAGVDPILGTDQPFTLFGLFTPQLDTQRVLVFPIEPELRLLPAEKLDARFTSQDQSGQTLVWEDSLIEQENGEFNHLFWHPFRAEYGHTYEVVVEGAPGARTEVTVTVPPEIEIELLDPEPVSDVILPVMIRGGAPNLLKIELRYGFDYEQLSAGEKLDHLILPIDDRKTKVEEGWLIRINLSRDYRTIRDFIRSQRAMDLTYGIRLGGIFLRFLVASADWDPPGGAFDPEVLVQPGTMSNVQNGFGFVGAGYRAQINWIPADSLVSESGFR